MSIFLTDNQNIDQSKIVARCQYHKSNLTTSQLKLKGCLNKENSGNNCRHLEKVPHQYWKEKEKKRLLIEKRNQLVEYANKISTVGSDNITVGLCNSKAEIKLKIIRQSSKGYYITDDLDNQMWLPKSCINQTNFLVNNFGKKIYYQNIIKKIASIYYQGR